jgi:hypothetical protein
MEPTISLQCNSMLLRKWNPVFGLNAALKQLDRTHYLASTMERSNGMLMLNGTQ